MWIGSQTGVWISGASGIELHQLIRRDKSTDLSFNLCPITDAVIMIEIDPYWQDFKIDLKALTISIANYSLGFTFSATSTHG